MRDQHNLNGPGKARKVSHSDTGNWTKSDTGNWTKSSPSDEDKDTEKEKQKAEGNITPNDKHDSKWNPSEWKSPSKEREN